MHKMIQPLTREEALRRALEIVAEQHRQGNLTKDQVAILNHIISDGYLRGVETDLTTEISDYARPDRARADRRWAYGQAASPLSRSHRPLLEAWRDS